MSGSASVRGAQTSGATSADSLRVSGSTSAAGANFNSVLNFATGSSIPGSKDEFGLQLTPHTRLVAGADYSASATVFDACTSVVCEQSYGQVSIHARGDLVGSDLAGASADARGDLNSDARSGSLQLLLDNVGNDTASLELQFDARVNGVGAVPEPETYALMLLGLGALGIVARRRKRR